MTITRVPLTTALGRGLAAGVAGTVVMTAFQRGVEMPLTGRPESYAPAQFAAKLLPVRPSRTVNEVTHLALGTMWGTAYAVAASRGLRGAKAVATVFGVVYTTDVLLNTALGLYAPSSWSAQDWAVDVVDKLVQAAATGAVFEALS